MTLNLTTEEGQTVFRQLSREADVVVENFRVGKMEEWGLDYESLRAENSGLVYCSLSGYGEWGPDKDRPAYDIIIQAEGGMMSITGESGREPVRVGVAIADIGAGMYATQGILSALLKRELGDGTGQKVDISLLDGQVAWMSYMASNYFATGDPPSKMGSKHPTITPYQAFETKNGYIVVAAASEAIWTRFCEAIEREDLLEDPRFSDNASRVEHRDALDALLDEEFAQYTTEKLENRFEENDVPASPIRDIEEVFNSPQVQARNMRWTVPHPTAGEIQMAGSPMHFSETPTTLREHPPLLGEQTHEILSEVGYTESEILRLEESGVI